MDYRNAAKGVLESIGGASNIVSAAHCATRLRLVIADNSRCSKAALEEVEGVKGVFEAAGQIQIIFGTGTVNKVFDEFVRMAGIQAGSKEDVKQAAASKQNLFLRAIKTLGDIFVPIIPAIVASGLLMGLLEGLCNLWPSMAESGTYQIFHLFSNTAFTFLPVLIAISAARVFGGNLFLGAVIGMIMIHPNLINAWSVAGMEASEIPVWHILGLPIRQVGYQGHVIPVIMAVWLMSQLEKRLHKAVPEMIDLFVTPLCTVLITGFLTLGIIGPIFSVAENYVLDFAQWIISVGHGIGSMIMGALYPLTVVCGIHHMYNVIEAGMLSAEGGLNIWMPIASAANFAQGAACLAVGLKAKNHKMKAVAIPSSLSAALGITEPAIFGVNLRLVKPLVCGMIGGAAGALLGAMFHIGATSYGVTGIPGFLITLDYTAQYAITLAVSFAIAFALTWAVWKDEEEEENKEEDVPPAAASENEMQGTVQASTGKETEGQEAGLQEEGQPVCRILAPVAGKVIPLAEIPDPIFAGGILGDGVGIDPEVGEVCAPFDGTIASTTDTLHAIGLTGPGGVEMLIHVGIDTVNMKGEGFQLLVKMGDTVKAGQKLLTFDINKIREAGYSPVTAVLVANSAMFASCRPEKLGEISQQEPLITVR